MRTRATVGVLLVLTILMVGCTSADLVARADQVERGADVIRDTSAQVEQGTADHADLISVVGRYVPAQWQDELAEALRISEDAPDTGRQIADRLDAFADDLRIQAAKEQSNAENFLSGFGLLLTTVLGGTGAGGIVGSVIGLVRGRREGAETVAHAVQTAADRDEGFRTAIKSGAAGDALKRELQRAPAPVRKAIDKHKV